MPKTIFLKMRGIKKILGNEMLQLAIMLSLLRVDPDSLLFGSPNHSAGDLFDGDFTGDVWTQTRFGDLFGSFGFGDLSPRLHPKSLDSMVERFHSEILEDLNNLGSYNRIRSYNGAPVEISAFIVNTNVSQVPSTSPGDNNSVNGDSDSGISGSDSSDAGESDHEDQARVDIDEGAVGLASPFYEASLLDSELELVGDPREVLGAMDDFIADPEDLENELVHIDDQLITIEDNLEEISDEFLYLDEQLAVHIEQEENGGFLAAEILDSVAYDANPYDEWQLDANSGLEELGLAVPEALLENDAEKETRNGYNSASALDANGDVGCRNGSVSAGSKFSCFSSSSHSGTVYTNNNDRNGASGSRGEAAAAVHPIAPSAAENQLWNGDGKFEQSSLEDLFRTPAYPEGLLRNVSLHNPSTVNDSFPQGASGGVDGLSFGQSAANLTANSTTQTASAAEEQQAGIDPFLGLHSVSDSEIIKDIISVLGGRDLQDAENASLWGRNSGSHHSNLLQNNNLDEDRAVNVTDFSPEESHHGFPGFHPSSNAGPIAISLPGYAGYHPYMSAAAAAAIRSSQQYTPLTNHTYATSSSNVMSQPQMDDLETASHTSGKSNRSKDFSFDSDSIKQDPDGCAAAAAERLRQSRDERKARELGIQFSIHDIINLPMDEFNDMLSRHELNEEQLNMCRDIRRRGKNKVAAQNCRKRKIDQIAHLEVQVNEARERKRQLLDERQQLYRQREEWRNKLSIIEEDVLMGMNKNGKEFALDLSTPDVRIVRRQVSSQGATAMANSSERIDPRFQSLTSTSYHGRYVWKGSSSGGGNS